MFHGTNGNALAWVNEIENRQLSNRLMASDYGIIAITSEESEFEMDFNNDGNYRWSYGIDSNLIDIANIRAIRDALLLVENITKLHRISLWVFLQVVHLLNSLQMFFIGRRL